MIEFLTKSGKLLIGGLLTLSIVLYFYSPRTFNFLFCIECFAIFMVTAATLLVNNIYKYKTGVLFEVLFTLAFFFVNYAYPVFIYSNTPYFSLFLYGFNEDIISKATALATIGYCGYSLFQFEERSQLVSNKTHSYISKVSSAEIFLLFFLLLIYVYQALPALIGGYSYSGGAGFFRILAIFLSFKRLYNHQVKHPLIRDIALWSIIAIYVIVNLLVGNRGDPLYVIMAIFVSYTLFVRAISTRLFVTSIFIGMAIFFVIGQARARYGDTSNNGTMIERISNVQRDDYAGGVLMYGKELIINNRSLYVLVDYADSKGFDYGQSWQLNVLSVVPFMQTIFVKLFNIQTEFAASVNLTTYLEFGNEDPEAFGLGTNLIGDIYVCFGMIGVVLFMAILGYVIKLSYRKSKLTAGAALVYVCLFVFAVYYPRAAYLEPVRLIVWSWIMFKISFKSYKISNRIS